MTDVPTNDKVLVANVEYTLNIALEILRQITPEGWDRVYYLTMVGKNVERWTTNDLAMIKDARLLSMRGGPRFRPQT